MVTSRPHIHKRKLRNLVVDRRALLRLSIPFLTMAFISIGIVFAVRQTVMGGLESVQIFGLENLPAMNTLHELQDTITTIATLGLAILTLACLGFWIIASHRIFGPTVAIRRHIQHLSKGEFHSRVRLREGDELREVAEDLNKLAESLSQNEQSKQAS